MRNFLSGIQGFDSTSLSSVTHSQSAPAPSSEQQQQQTQQQTPATSQSPETSTICLNPLLGVAPLGPQPLSKEHGYQLTMLDAAYHHLPHPSDSERLRYVFYHFVQYLMTNV